MTFALTIALGTAIIVAILLDFLMTTITLRSEGYLTRLLTGLVERGVYAAGESLRAYCGPIGLVALALFWIAGQWLGWTLVFHAGRADLVGPDQAPQVGFWDAAGFAGATLSTLGLGVVTPVEPWLHFAVVFASVCGMMVLTLSVTYVLNVQAVANRSRSVALQMRDIAHVLDACRTVEERTRDLLSRAGDLRATLHDIADRRDSFPLAQLYELRGSTRDIARRASQFRDLARPSVEAANGPRERTELRLLIDALGRLTSTDDAASP